MKESFHGCGSQSKFRSFKAFVVISPGRHTRDFSLKQFRKKHSRWAERVRMTLKLILMMYCKAKLT